MRELDIDLSGRRPRGIEREDVEWADVVVTMGCGRRLPGAAGKRYVDWNLPDPSAARSKRSERCATTSSDASKSSPFSRFTRARPHPMGGE